MLKIVFDRPKQIPGTGIYRVPAGIFKCEVNDVPKYKMIGYVEYTPVKIAADNPTDPDEFYAAQRDTWLASKGYDLWTRDIFVEPDNRPEVVITNVTGALEWEGGNITAKQGVEITVEANVTMPAGTIYVPIRSPNHVGYTTAVSDGAGLLTLTYTFDNDGLWSVSEADFNGALGRGSTVRFANMNIRVVR